MQKKIYLIPAHIALAEEPSSVSASTRENSQWPVVPAPENPAPSGLFRHLYPHTHNTETHTETHHLKAIEFLKSKKYCVAGKSH